MFPLKNHSIEVLHSHQSLEFDNPFRFHSPEQVQLLFLYPHLLLDNKISLHIHILIVMQSHYLLHF